MQQPDLVLTEVSGFETDLSPKIVRFLIRPKSKEQQQQKSKTLYQSVSLRYNFVVIFLSVFFVLLLRVLSQHIILLLPLSSFRFSAAVR